MTFEHVAPARTAKAVLVLGAIWAALAAGWIWLDAEGWIVAGLALFTLPLVFELITGKVARLALDDRQMNWQSGRLVDAVPLADIAHVRLDRRYDGTMRASLVLTDDRRLRLPQDCVPPTDRFEEALKQAGLRVERHPFSLF